MLHIHAHRCLSGIVRELRSAWSTCPNYRGVAVLETTLRVAYGRRPYGTARTHRETLSKRRRNNPASNGARRELEYARGSVRLRQFSFAQYAAAARAAHGKPERSRLRP